MTRTLNPAKLFYHTMPYNWLVAIPWCVLGAYWIISARDTKKNAYQARSWWRWGGLRIAVIAACLIFLPQTRYFKHRVVSGTPAIRDFGIILCVVGVAFAIWARWTLGANWSSVPSIKEGHELATAGPYRFVRHPIYGGMLVALLGSSVAAGEVWLIILALAVVMFAFRIRKEERLMTQQFPKDYPDYASRTHVLIPFIL